MHYKQKLKHETCNKVSLMFIIPVSVSAMLVYTR